MAQLMEFQKNFIIIGNQILLSIAKYYRLFEIIRFGYAAICLKIFIAYCLIKILNDKKGQ